MNPTTTAPARKGYRPPVGRRSTVGTGTTSLLMIFTVLCFATLAMLSLSTALADQRIQGRGLARAQDLAAARGEAARAVAVLDADLAERRAAGADEEEYEVGAGLNAAARGWAQDANDLMIFYLVVPVDEANELVTEIRLQPLAAGERYVLLRQYTRLVDGWTPEGSGGVWIPS